METFIHETMLNDVSLCDALIDYHTNNLEYKMDGSIGRGIDNRIKKSTDVYVYAGNQNPIIQMYMQEILNSVKEYINKYDLTDMFDVAFKENWNIQPVSYTHLTLPTTSSV